MRFRIWPAWRGNGEVCLSCEHGRMHAETMKELAEVKKALAQTMEAKAAVERREAERREDAALPPFVHDPACAKCGSTEIEGPWHDRCREGFQGRFVDEAELRDRLGWRCKGCGWSWRTKPLS